MTTEFDLSRALDVRVANQDATEIRIANQTVWEKDVAYFEGFSSGLGGWYGYNESLVPTGGDSGPFIRELGAAPFNEWGVGFYGSVNFDVGTQVRVSWSMRSSVVRSVSLSFVFFDASDSLLGAKGSSATTATVWTRYDEVVSTTSGTAAEMGLDFTYAAAGVAGETLDIDSVTVTPL